MYMYVMYMYIIYMYMTAAAIRNAQESLGSHRGDGTLNRGASIAKVGLRSADPDAADAPDAVWASRATHPRARLVRGHSRAGMNPRQASQARQDAGGESRNSHDSE